MKSRFKSFTKVLFAIVMALSVLVMVLPASDVQAAKKMTNKSAQKILKKKIKNKFCSYTFADIDNDNIDEMFVLSYSSKFVDGDAKTKKLTVYKVVNKKAKAIFTDSIDGDMYHPTITFELFKDDEFYMTVFHDHELYASSVVYMYGADSFNEIARLEADLSSGEAEYRIRGKVCSQDEFFGFLAGYDAEDVDYTLNSCSTKVANKYLKKMLKAEYNYRCKTGVYDKTTSSIVYSDEDGDGIDELIVRINAISGEVLHAVRPNDSTGDYYVDSIAYKIENGNIVYDIPVDYSGDEDWGEVDGEQYIGSYQSGRCGINIVREGESAFVFDIKWGSSAFETDQWIYFAFYQGEDKDGNAYFVCSDGGSHVRHLYDDATGKDTDEVIATDLAAEFMMKDGKLYWHDLSDSTNPAWDMEFEKLIVVE